MYAFSKKYAINLDEYIRDGFAEWMTSTMDLIAIAFFMRFWLKSIEHDMSNLKPNAST